jgi:hypothetical protein
MEENASAALGCSAIDAAASVNIHTHERAGLVGITRRCACRFCVTSLV